jgi:hypothetical protein
LLLGGVSWFPQVAKMWIVGSYQQSLQRVAQSGKPTDELNSRNYGTLTPVFVLGIVLVVRSG